MDNISINISLISLLLSVLVFGYNVIIKIKDKNIYFNSIYSNLVVSDKILKIFPRLIQEVAINSRKDVYDEIEKFIIEFGQDLKFLEYFNYSMYKKIIKRLTSIDELVILICARSHSIELKHKRLYKEVSGLYKTLRHLYA